MSVKAGKAHFREGAQHEAVFRRLEVGRLILVRYCPLRDAQ